MRVQVTPLRTALCVCFAFLCQIAFAQDPPSGFATVTVSGQWNEAVGLAFSKDGRDMFVWERGGKVWVVRNNQRQLLLDITEEVGGWHDHGMLGFALHPYFDQNGQFYVLYAVDRHHLKNFGTAAYNPSINEFYDATIGRLTRYTTTKNTNGYALVPGSRKVLIGETISTGVPILSITHSTGSIVFGTDNTLLVATGDGASSFAEDNGSHSSSYFVKGLADGIIRPNENVGSFRSQMLDCYNGKILRIDSETGAGIPSNPFYDPARPNSAQSKVWALGLRNPFRMSLKPGTGSHNRDEGNPGILYLGDVGWNTWEEINVVERPGQNFGWPIYEGHVAGDGSVYASMLTPNRDALNPLYQNNGCNQQYFNFQDLLKQQTPDGNGIFPNPCNGSQEIPANVPKFVHTRPLIAWRHCCQPASVATFNGQNATTSAVLPGASPVPGPEFTGRSSTGGVFYTGADFADYQNTYFFADYASGWVRNISIDGNDKPTQVRNFIDEDAIAVAFATHPLEEGLYYVNFPDEIRKVYFSSNRPPVAVATSDKAFGSGPLTVQFKGDASSDHENQALTYQWNFGDGSPASNVVNPTHTFNAATGVATPFIVTLRITDAQGASQETTLNISVNNTPPEVNITSPVDNSKYSLTDITTYTLHADVNDTEHAGNQLTYRWQVVLAHDDHQHPNPPNNAIEPQAEIVPLGCDGQVYFYRILLTVTDAAGAATTKEVRIYPDCDGTGKVNPVITWANPAPITAGTPLSAVQLNATVGYNGSTVPGTFAYTPALGTVLAAGSAQQLQTSFTPTDASVYNAVTRTVAINVTANAGTFYRAINLNGPALNIEGRNWEASSSAPGFSSTNAMTFTDNSVILNPATDANRTQMIRSSIWGGTFGIALGNVPTGAYDVYLYVWEDNAAETYSISLEGTVVRANFTSGSAGSWSKLGPYRANITDGTINVNSTGGAANFSGLEIWSVGSQPSTPPSLNNPVADQVATVGANYNFTLPANTFGGTTLSYVAALSGGDALPSWLSFNAATRTFNGSPAVGNIGTTSIRVTASNAFGSASDEFNITVNAASEQTFYRAINLNGPALTIDGRNWEASASAPGFTTTNSMTFVDNNVTLVPSTDANRSSMIRSSIWGGNFGIALGNVPAGTYEIYLYVWEDNAAETFTLLLEGNVVRAGFNSGTAGSWTRLGPYRANINDGTINVNATGGAANFSGLEIWSVGSQPSTQPSLSNPVADQAATVGTSYNFTFAANTFAGTSLVYTATLSDGTTLPSWLAFNATTRTFSGTPGAGNTGTSGILVTATNALGSAFDEFNITVNAASAQTFYRAINLNGPPLTIDGRNWEASASAPGFSTTNSMTFVDNSVTLVPATDANRTTMIRSSIWGGNFGIAVGNVPAGTYEIYLHVWEDNFPETFSVLLEGAVVRTGFNSGTAGSWTRLGPYRANITDGTINVNATGGAANFSGLEIWSVAGQPATPPVVVNPIADQVATTGSLYNFTFAANTFSGSTLNYAATLTDGNVLPSWLSFNASSRTFSGIPPAGSAGILGIRVTAANTFGSTSDVFNITVNAAVVPTFYRAINLNGVALSIDGRNWEASASAPGFSTTNSMTFVDNSVTLIPATDANRTAMIRSSIWGSNVGIALGNVPAGTYDVYLYVWEDNFSETFSVSLEGIVVRTGFNSGAAGSWTKLGPYRANISDGTINVNANGGAANFSGLEIWSVPSQSASNARIATTTPAENTLVTEANAESTGLTASPNPFNDKMTVTFTSRQTAHTQLVLLDVRGGVVKSLFSQNTTADTKTSVVVESGDLPNGVYMIELINGSSVRQLRVVIMR